MPERRKRQRLVPVGASQLLFHLCQGRAHDIVMMDVCANRLDRIEPDAMNGRGGDANARFAGDPRAAHGLALQPKRLHAHGEHPATRPQKAAGGVQGFEVATFLFGQGREHQVTERVPGEIPASRVAMGE